MKREIIVGVAVASICALGIKSVDWMSEGGIIRLLGGRTQQDPDYSNKLTFSTHYFADRPQSLSECVDALAAAGKKKGYTIEIHGADVTLRYRPQSHNEALAYGHCYKGNISGYTQLYVVVSARDKSSRQRRDVLSAAILQLLPQSE